MTSNTNTGPSYGPSASNVGSGYEDLIAHGFDTRKRDQAPARSPGHRHSDASATLGVALNASGGANSQGAAAVSKRTSPSRPSAGQDPNYLTVHVGRMETALDSLYRAWQAKDTRFIHTVSLTASPDGSACEAFIHYQRSGPCADPFMRVIVPNLDAMLWLAATKPMRDMCLESVELADGSGRFVAFLSRIPG
jgi:hypothetical protein